MTAKHTGRRPGDPEVTRVSILEAARTRFAAVGFERATIRSIARDAGVDPALVHHHFGSKQSLFVSAHELPFNPSRLVAELATTPPGSRGAAIARAYLTLMAPESPALSLLRGAATNEGAARMLREFIEDALLRHAATLTSQPDARLRLTLIATHMMGIVFGRAIVGLPDLVQTDTDRLVAAVAPTIERYLTDPDLFEATG